MNARKNASSSGPSGATRAGRRFMSIVYCFA